jgi:predicted lipoprotein with Yx(FWY)xxD motif
MTVRVQAATHTRRPRLLLVGLLGLTLLVLSCGPAKPSPSASPTPSPSAGPALAPGAYLIGIIHSDALGALLTARQTLYAYAPDGVGASACTGSCATTWPPFVLKTGEQALGAPGVSGVIATITRADGGRQVTYGGRPLYTYSGDAHPGEINGEGIDGAWHVVAP